VNEWLQQLEEKEIYDYIVINDDLKKASNDFNATIEDILTNLIEK
jgi:guanylate kinase